jgi:hypothetical protein
MMNVNQSVLASAVINITGNTRGLDYAINQTRRQMQGFMVFANAIGGKTGGALANVLSMGAAGPILNNVLGPKIGGKATGYLQKMGLTSDPMGDVADAMERAKRQFTRDTFAHKMQGAGISLGNTYNGQRLNTPLDVKTARIRHSMNTPKMADYTQSMVSGAAAEGQKLAILFGKIGLVVTMAIPVFAKLLSSGMELDRHMRRASRVFGSTLGAATNGYSVGSNMSLGQYLSGASGIGQQLTHQGIGSGRSSVMASGMAQRAGGMASAWGAEFEDVASSMQAAIGGSNTAMKQFGVVLSDDLVRAYAFNNGMIKYLEVMSDSVAAQARYNLIMSQTSKSVNGAVAEFFSLGHQWNAFTSTLGTALSSVGSAISPIAAACLGATNALINFVATVAATPYRLGKYLTEKLVGPDARPDAGIDKQAMLEQADQDAKRADQAIQRERSRQSSNVGFHRPEDFYNHIQKGIFGDPVEFQKRQTDLMHEFVIVSKEQLAVMRDFGFKVKDGSSLLMP